MVLVYLEGSRGSSVALEAVPRQLKGSPTQDPEKPVRLCGWTASWKVSVWLHRPDQLLGPGDAEARADALDALGQTARAEMLRNLDSPARPEAEALAAEAEAEALAAEADAPA